MPTTGLDQLTTNIHGDDIPTTNILEEYLESTVAEYYILRKKNGQTINEVHLVEKASFSFDKFSVGRLLGSVQPIGWVYRQSLISEAISRIVLRKFILRLLLYTAVLNVISYNLRIGCLCRMLFEEM